MNGKPLDGPSMSEEVTLLRQLSADVIERLRSLTVRAGDERDLDRIDVLARDMEARVQAASEKPTEARFRAAHCRSAACAAVLAVSLVDEQERRAGLSALYRQLALLSALLLPPDTEHTVH